jgi:hypothetical protein
MLCAGRDSRFPPFRKGRGKMGHPSFLAGVRLSGLASMIMFRIPMDNARGAGRRGVPSALLGAGSSTAHSGSLCEPEYYAQDDNVERDPRDTKQRTLPHASVFQGWALQSREAVGLILFQK